MSLQASEAALTGESAPVGKEAEHALKENRF
jgi:magnesium-transporting ATPase (P-type)